MAAGDVKMIIEMKGYIAGIKTLFNKMAKKTDVAIGASRFARLTITD